LTERNAALTRKNPKAKPSPQIYDDAFSLQEGEYWPEHHIANVKRLSQRYPEYSRDEVDAIYRKACTLEPEIEKWIGTLELSEGSRSELLEWLADQFYGFTNKSFLWALERVEDKRKRSRPE
jgi:hypothetical protein